MPRHTRFQAALAAVCLSTLASAAHAANDAYALTAEGQLLRFSAAGGQVIESPAVDLYGFRRDTKLVGIDFRVQDGYLYGVGDAGGVYRIRGNTGRVVLVNRLTVPLEGTAFGVDFNPAADRLRIVSDTGQNLRHAVTPDFVTLVDGTLNNGAVPPVNVTGVGGAAYTNNDLSATTGTTLFVLSLGSAVDTIGIQAPPNNGSLSSTGTLSVDASTVGGFDIVSQVVPETGETTNTGYAALNVGGSVNLYRANLLDGVLTSLGTFTSNVVDIAYKL